MGCVRCYISMYDGNWRRPPSQKEVRSVLETAFPPHSDDCLVSIEFVEPEEDVRVQAEVVVSHPWYHEEVVQDKIIERLLKRFDPEYESMIEVEVWQYED